MRDRVICLCLVLTSNPAVLALGKEAVYIVLAAVLTVIWMMHGMQVTRRDLLILAVLAGLSLFHVASFGFEVVPASAGFLVRVVLGLLAVRLVPEFHRHFASLMHALALVSFVFYVPVVLGVDLASSLAAIKIPVPYEVVHIGIHNFHSAEVATRNCGMFHEPGMFAGYLVLAILFLVGDTGPATTRHVVILALAVLTTKSTMGYIALFPALFMHLVARRLASHARGALLYALPALVVVGAAAWTSYETLPFMKAKIIEEHEGVLGAAEGAEITRIGNFLFDIQFIEKRPLTGWSPRLSVRGAVDPDIMKLAQGQGNGLSGFAVMFGLLGLAGAGWFMFGLFRQRHGSVELAVMAVCVVAIMLNGQQFLNEPSFLSLFFVPSVVPDADAPREAGDRPYAVAEA